MASQLDENKDAVEPQPSQPPLLPTPTANEPTDAQEIVATQDEGQGSEPISIPLPPTVNQPPSSLSSFMWEIVSFIGAGLEDEKNHHQLNHPAAAVMEASSSEPHEAEKKEAEPPQRTSGDMFGRRMSFKVLPDMTNIAAQTNALAGMFGSFMGLSQTSPTTETSKELPEAADPSVVWEAAEEEEADTISTDRPLVKIDAGKPVENAPPLLIDPAFAEKIRPHLPPLLKEASTWKLIYSLDRHGISMQSLYRNCEGETSASLIVVKDTNGTLFGAFSNEPLHVKTGFFGNGSRFGICAATCGLTLFTSGANDYLVLCEPHFIAFGGGEGRFGLWLSEDLDHGHSEPCLTFANDHLSDNPDFHVASIDVYSFVM
ncbi:hypothetical protein HDU97_003837 [Phlyctochytrium planicorne]|nr:hypothetical protein HDU97_003837 [Phlyctochytrium planicorne]